MLRVSTNALHFFAFVLVDISLHRLHNPTRVSHSRVFEARSEVGEAIFHISKRCSPIDHVLLNHQLKNQPTDLHFVAATVVPWTLKIIY